MVDSSMKLNKPDPEIFSLMAATGVRRDMATRAAYVSDASIFRRVPAAVVEPESVDEIRDALAIAREMNWSVIGRGGGTSVAGNAIGDGIIIDTSRNFNKIIEIDAQKQRAVVQPGVICDFLREAVRPYGLTYGPDPSTHSRCTIGGMVANNACGSHSVAYGTAAENLLSVTMMMADGREVTFGKDKLTDPVLEQALRSFTDINQDVIRQELGRFPRQVSGYGLHYLLEENGVDFAKAMAGAEGTLGIITQLEVKLVSIPRFKSLAVLAFSTVFDAAEAAAKLRLPGVATVEGMGGDLLDALRSKNGRENAGGSLPGNRKGLKAGGWLFCETGGDSQEEALRIAEQVVSAVDTIDSLIVSEDKEMKDLWSIRESSAGLVTRLPDGGEAWPNWEDSAVPPENLASYLRGLYDLMDTYGLRGIPFGHFGEGCVHVRISFDFSTQDGLANFKSFMTEAAELVSSHGGSLSGEHGDGRARSELLGHMYSDGMLALFKDFKNHFDSENVFNPGVLVNPDPVTQGVRMAPGQRKFELTPVHSLSKDGGSLVNAVNRCVGVSACRSNEGAMCPSFQITGDEVHSTRGRARLFSEMFRGDSITDGFESEELNEALDLCLSCKACASECPVNVDMATYKSEFLHKHYKGKLRPLAHYVMGWLPLSGYLIHKIPLLPKLVDRVMANSITSRVIAKLGGLDSGRPLIRFSHESLRKWSSRRKGKPSTSRVVLWPDSFNASLNTSPATAAVEVLEHLGYEVVIPQEFVCCGLTWHSTGQLGMTQQVLKQSAKVMKKYLDEGLEVVGVEPSCTVMLRSEAVELTEDPEIKRLANATYSFAEFVAPAIKGMMEEGTIERIDCSALTQVHCHERSLGDPSQSALILDALGVGEEQIETGCCGLAGNWGFEKGHADMSLELGERELFPKVREAEKSGKFVIADGFSCRTQIEQGTGVSAKHVAEIVRDILNV